MGDTNLKDDLEERFLSLGAIPKHWLADFQTIFKAEPIKLESLLHFEPSTTVTSLEFDTVGLGGELAGHKEITRTTTHSLDAKSSTSLQRAPADYSNFVRGKAGYFPFAPGSNVVPEVVDAEAGVDVVESLEKALDLTGGGLKTIPPGFEYGLDFQDDETTPDDDFGEVSPVYQPTQSSQVNGTRHTEENDAYIDVELARLLPSEKMTTFEQSSNNKKRKAVIAKRDWAHVVDVNQELVNFHDLVPDMAKQYPFELDTFQKEAVYHMEQGDSVFVAAHTSAGKTVVAEYAIALAIKHMTRAIYTSPIKALSNQKFRDFKDTFGLENVGILTGDVQINPEASCLIMTTEILRSMLYKGADLIRDIEWVIFDEVHYVNDLERGVVWEEVIIMLPAHVGIVLLSATVPNTKEFANWVGRTQQKDIYVISTPKRPVPLEHFLYAGRDMHQILDARGQEHLSQGIKGANEALKRKQEKEREAAIAAGNAPKPARGGPPGRGGVQTRGRGQSVTRGRGGGRTMAQQDRNLWIHLIGSLKKKELLPVVVFTFSKRRCEDNAASMPNTDLCTAAERSEVHIVIERSLTRLKEIDRKLPQIKRMRDLLGRGIGVHHGGLLPIVKEVVEILFARGLVKVLFATETFAMGVNMPAKCVVFSNIRKHDGRSFRDLLAGEYTQMSGRAGRRGLDKTGVVLIVCDGEVPDSATLHKLLLGSATKLTSQFRLTYTMILNLLRVEALRVEDVIRRSFSENASQRLLPDQQKRVTESEKKLNDIPDLRASPDYTPAKEFYALSRDLVDLNTAMLLRASNHQTASKTFSSGRLVFLRNAFYAANPAFIMRPANSRDETSAKTFIVMILRLERDLPTESASAISRPPRWPAPLEDYLNKEVYCEITSVNLFDINLVTRFGAKLDITGLLDTRKQSALNQAISELRELLKSLKSNSLTSTEIGWDRIRDLDFRELIMKRTTKLAKLEKLSISPETLENIYPIIHLENVLQDQIADLRLSLSDQNLELLPEYQQMTEVLKDLKFIDTAGTIQLKGRVACEINSVNELILTELILDNILAEYEPAEIVAMLSALVFREKSDNEPMLTPKLEEAVVKMRQIAERIDSVQRFHKIEHAEDASKNNDLRLGMMEVAFEWARGMPFHQICDLTDVQEGTIVHTITRLDETCREVRDAARIIGDATLYQKMEACQTLIKRDIVFAASLYL